MCNPELTVHLDGRMKKQKNATRDVSLDGQKLQKIPWRRGRMGYV